MLFFPTGIHKLPDPVLNDDGHYSSFDEVYGLCTSESDCPSVAEFKRKKTLNFNATQQHVKNVNMLVQCEECELWRLLYSKKKIDPKNISFLEKIVADITYRCGATFDDLQLPTELQSVCVKVHQCYDPMEKLSYSCGFPIVCYYCARDLNESVTSSEYYPQSSHCAGKPPIKKSSSTKRKKGQVSQIASQAIGGHD
jgi:hypothetical protein